MTDMYESPAKLFRVLGHPARLHILNILLISSCRVCDIARLTGYRQPYISQQLAILRQARLVDGDREGRTVCYRLASPAVRRLLIQNVITMQPMPPQQHEP